MEGRAICPSCGAQDATATTDVEIKNLEQCVLYWTHGEMGYTQTPSELEEIEQKISDLEKQRDNTFNGYCQYCGGEIRGNGGHGGYACKECTESGFAKRFDESITPEKKGLVNRIKIYFLGD